MAYSQEQQYWIWLASVPGLGVRRFDALLDRYLHAQQIWEEFGAWMAPVLGAQVYAAMAKARDADYFARLFDEMDAANAVAVTRMDAEYPAQLRTIVDAPPVLYVRGRVAQGDAQTIGIVGARNCSAYGTRMARRMAGVLSRAGVVVVSGLARGIDGAAHRGAVDAKARTVAVLGSGVDVIYPPEHARLVDEMLAAGGSLISELRPGTAPKPQHFPARNRIISGMSGALLLVEAAAKSGAMSTVRHALEQGREVFTVPGQADSPLSAMPHALVRDGARLVTSAQDILQDMGWPGQAQAAAGGTGRVRLPLTLAEQQIWNALAAGVMDTDQLVETLKISPPALNSHLTILELQGIIRKLPGRKIERIEDVED